MGFRLLGRYLSYFPMMQPAVQNYNIFGLNLGEPSPKLAMLKRSADSITELGLLSVVSNSHSMLSRQIMRDDFRNAWKRIKLL
jgi:hypothetical protein